MSAVLLIGANGQLGSDLRRLRPEVEAVTRAELDVRHHDTVAQELRELRPGVVINAAAAVNVEECEEQRDHAFAVNSAAVENLARVCAGIDARLVHISTDYVIDGTARKPYTENAPAHPINVYGASKLAGENHIRALTRRHLIIRSSGLYGTAGSRGKGGNFITSVIDRAKSGQGEVDVVIDQELAPTNTHDLAAMIWRMVDEGAEGTFHATNGGSCTWNAFARAIFELRRDRVTVRPITSAELGLKARRPAYSVLDNSKLEGEGFDRMRPWREALASHLESLGSLT